MYYIVTYYIKWVTTSWTDGKRVEDTSWTYNSILTYL